MAFLSLAAAWPADVRAACSPEPVCPSGYASTRICRQPCATPGTFRHHFGENCSDGWVPVNGVCRWDPAQDSPVFAAGGGEARQIAGISLDPFRERVPLSTQPTPRCETGTPRCPSLVVDWGLGYVCRRPCLSGGYFYQFGTNCIDGTEPAPGSCVREGGTVVYRPGTSLAVMEPGARRPGETHHRASFEITWDCHAPIGPGGTTPPARAFTFTYGRAPWGHGSFRDEDAVFDSSEWDRFVASLPETVDTLPCLDRARWAISGRFSHTCVIVEEAAGQTAERARSQCTSALHDLYALPVNARTARRQGQIAARATVPMSMPGAPLAADDDDAHSQLSVALAYSRAMYPLCRRLPSLTLAHTRALISSDYSGGGHLERLVQGITPGCKGAVLAHLLDALAEAQPPGCVRNPEHANCRRVREGTTDVLRDWIRAFGAAEGDPLYTLASREAEYLACFRASDRPASLLRDIELALRQAETCVELGYRPSAQSAVINTYDVGTGLPARYRLTRTSRDLYQVELNLEFTPEAARAAREEHVDRCFRDANPDLKGPGTQRLELVRTTSSEVPVNPIELMDRPTRSNMAYWSSRIDCKTIVHEVMHLLGLVDEYHEEWSGSLYDPATGAVRRIDDVDETRPREGETFLSEYNCRITGPDNSLMSRQSDAYRAVGGFLGLGIFTSRDSLLYPAHFRAITQPGCVGANRQYYRCSVRAYETSYSALGEGCTRGLDPSCVNGSEDWLK